MTNKLRKKRNQQKSHKIYTAELIEKMSQISVIAININKLNSDMKLSI